MHARTADHRLGETTRRAGRVAASALARTAIAALLFAAVLADPVPTSDAPLQQVTVVDQR